MATFFRWFVRWPAYALSAASLGLAWAGAFDPEVGFTAAFICALIGYVAGMAQRRAEAAARRKALMRARPQLSLIPGLKPQRGRTERAA
ncbi:MAG: hypothetical protein ACM3S1_15520 [Hyphomicrobiales bacterium]